MFGTAFMTLSPGRRAGPVPSARPSRRRRSGESDVLRFPLLPTLAALLLPAGGLAAQTFPVPDPMLQRIWDEGMQRSQVETLMQALADSVGPRLTGSPGMAAGQGWLLATYGRWGIPARNVPYGTWGGWRRGVTHLDLMAPRVRSLEAMMLAWSPGTGGRPVQGPVAVLPEVADSAAFAAWLPSARGRFVLLSQPMPTCRPDESFRQFALPATFESMAAARNAARDAWAERLERTGLSARDLPRALEDAGALGVLTSIWPQGWGVTRIFQARTRRVPTLDLSCEDYGLVFRLAERGQGPVLRLFADAEFRGEVPVANTIAEVRGRELPDEYVVLSAHFDSWDGASGATDNGTGTVTMLEAMRILRTVYPAPRRTILAGHWNGEEQGLNGSRAFVQDRPEVVAGLQALFNQDNGTGRVVNMSASGLVGATSHLAAWLSRVPTEISRHITFSFPGTPAGGGSDHASFVCSGAPGFGLGSLGWEYGTYTWHTNRDTFDKVVMDELRNNAVLVAMLAYLAAEDPGRVPRDRRVLVDRDGRPAGWPACAAPARSQAESTR
jgi:carboxypeptidase Q